MFKVNKYFFANTKSAQITIRFLKLILSGFTKLTLLNI